MNFKENLRDTVLFNHSFPVLRKERQNQYVLILVLIRAKRMLERPGHMEGKPRIVLYSKNIELS